MSWHFGRFFRRVRGYLFEQTEAAVYKPITKENTMRKVIRIYQDKSYFAQNKSYLDEEHKLIHEQENQCLMTIFRTFFSRKKCTNPCSIKMLLWYFVVFWAILYFFLEVGIILTFGESLWLEEKQSKGYLAINLICLLILFADVIVQFRTGYLSRGMIITDFQRVVGRYLRFRFQLDLIILIILIVSICTYSFKINYIKTIVIFKFIRIFEFDQLYLRRLAVNRVLKMVYVIWQQNVIIFVLSHIIGVVYYWIDFALIASTCQPPNQNLCWLYSSTAYSPIISLPSSQQYFYIIYWGVSTITTISYGDIASNNPIETIYCILMMCFGFAVYAYVINAIIKVILWARSRSDKIKSQMILIDTYMKELHIQKQMKEDVREYLIFLHNQEMDRDQDLQQQLKAKLPEDLRLQLIKSAYSDISESLQFMLELGPSVGKLLFNIKQQLFTINQEVLVQDSFVNKLCFMNKGEVNYQCRFSNQIYTVATLATVNEYLGQREFFIQEKIGFTVVVQKSSSFCFIDRNVFEQECTSNPSFRQSLRLLEYSVAITKKYTKILYTCPECKKDHTWNECPQKFPVFTSVKLTDTTAKSKEEGLLARLRGPKQRHHTLFNRQRLYELDLVKKINEDSFYGRIGNRLMKIRDHIQTSNNLFEVDIAHDWSIYLPDQNLSKLREIVNQKKIVKKFTRHSAFGRQ